MSNKQRQIPGQLRAVDSSYLDDLETNREFEVWQTRLRIAIALTTLAMLSLTVIALLALGAPPALSVPAAGGLLFALKPIARFSTTLVGGTDAWADARVRTLEASRNRRKLDEIASAD